ncbi:MAG: hypothetical protein AAF092_09405 [Pseudomonadota bacterium]
MILIQPAEQVELSERTVRAINDHMTLRVCGCVSRLRVTFPSRWTDNVQVREAFHQKLITDA